MHASVTDQTSRGEPVAVVRLADGQFESTQRTRGLAIEPRTDALLEEQVRTIGHVENIKETRNAINDRFQKVRNQADARRQRLQETSTVHQFIRDLEDEEAQIREKKLLVTSDDYGRDFNQSQNLRRKHKRFEIDLGSHEPNVQNLQQLGSQLTQDVGNSDIDRKCKDLVHHWESLKQAADDRTKKLDESITYHNWASTLDEENAWIKERLHIMNNPDIGTTLVTVQGLQKKQESFEADFGTQKERCQDILQQGQKLIDQVTMKLELIIDKNVILKRDKPWSQFYALNDQALLCFNDQKKFESVDPSNGKIEHVSNRLVATASKSSLAHCLSSNGQLCAFLSSSFGVTIWDKDKLVETIPPCSAASEAIKTKSALYMSNSGAHVMLVLKHPCRLFLWLKSFTDRAKPIRPHHKSPICSSIGSHSNEETGHWHELVLTSEQLSILNDDHYDISTDVFFHPKNPTLIAAFVFLDSSGGVQLNRLDIDWKSTIHADQSITYTFETFRVPLSFPCQSCSIHFAHSSPILAIGLTTNILFISLTTINFSKIVPIHCSLSTSPTHQRTLLIKDFIWSYDDQFVIGLTNRGGLFFLHRFGTQVQLMTKGECITQGPTPFVIIHPLIGQDSEATTHLGLDSFMRSIQPFSKGDKTKQQQFSLAIEGAKPVIYCSDGYRLARLTYSNKIRDRRFYDPLLYLYLMDVNEKQRSVFTERTRSLDDLPEAIDQADSASLGGSPAGGLNSLLKYGSLVSLAVDDLTDMTLDEILSGYHLLLTSTERSQHDICACIERATRTLLQSSEHKDIFTPIHLSHCLTNLVLSASFGSLTFLHLSCLTKFIPLFIEIFQQQTTIVSDPELLQLCLLYIIEQWLQAVLHLPTRSSTFEVCRRQAIVQHQGDGGGDQSVRLCKAIKQLELLQGANVNLDEFLLSPVPHRQPDFQENHAHCHRLTLLRSWYTLWLSIEKKFHRDRKSQPKYLNTIRLFIQSLLSPYPSLNAVRLRPCGRPIDLNDLFPLNNPAMDHLLHTKGYAALNDRRKQRRRLRHSAEQKPSARPSRRRKPPTEARKALVLHRVLYALLEKYHVHDAVCVLNVALQREASLLASCLPLDLFSPNLFQHIDTRTSFGMPGHALRSVLRTLARFMARSLITTNEDVTQQQLFIYSVDSACPLPNLFKWKQRSHEQQNYRTILVNRDRLNLAVEQQRMSQFWQPLKVLELFVLGQSPHEAVLFAKLIGDWRTALCLASMLSPPHSSSSRTSPFYSPMNSVTVEALLYSKLCEYLQIDNLQSLVKRSHKQEDILAFIQNLSSTLEQYLLCSTLLHVPLTELLLRRLNAIMIYLFTLIPIFISSKYYLPCPPIYSSILNTYDDETSDITCKYEIHMRLLFYRILHIFIQVISASRIQLSCLKWYLDYLTMTENKRKQSAPGHETNDSFYSIRILLKSLRFHKLPNIPDRILMYFRDFCTILFLLDTRDRLSLALRQYVREKIELTHTSDKLAWQIISYATLLLSFRCLLSDEMNLVRTVLNLFFELPPSEQLMRALAAIMVVRQYDQDDDQRSNAELTLIVDKLKAKWSHSNPTYIQLYEGFLKTIIFQDVQADIIKHYMNDSSDPRHHEPMFDFKPKWFESSVEYGEFMTVVIPLLLDTSSLTHTHQQETNHDHSKFDTKSIPLVQSMAHQLRELELPLSLDKRYFLKQAPVLAATHEYIVFPVQMVPSDAQPSMFQQASSNVDSSAVGSFVHTSGAHQQPPDVVPLEHHHGHRQPAGGRADPNANPSSHPSIEWDGRSNDPSRSHVRQFDEPHADAARLGIWMSNWSNRDFLSTQDRTPTSGMRIPVTAQFLAATPLISDQQKYAMVLKQHQQKRKYHNDPADNDTDLTNVTKDSEEDDGNGTQSDFPSSPRRRDGSFRKNSLEESMSLPIMSADPGGDLGRSHDFRAPSRETIGDETPTYDLREFPTDYSRGPAYHGRDDEERASPLAPMSPPTSNGFNQQPHPLTSSTSNRRFLDDSDPYMSARLEQEDQEKYTVQDTHRSAVSKRSSISQYPPSLDQSSRRSPTRDRHNRRSPTRDGGSRRSPTRHANGRRSSSRDVPNQPTQHHFSQAPPFYDVSRAPAPMQYSPSFRLPLLRLGAPLSTATPMYSPPRLPPPPPLAVPYPARPYFAPPVPQPNLPMLHFAPQLPPAAAFAPRAIPHDQAKSFYVQNMMQQYAEHHRPRLQLLQLRAHPRGPPTGDWSVPMPASNVVTQSSETKIDTGVQVEVPREDGFVIEPGLFQKLLRDATGVNLTSAEAHYSAARQIEQQALDARRRERATMTDLPAHQILYDLQYGRGGEGDARKFVNVTDIAGPQVDALLSQIERDQMQREQHRAGQQDPTSIPPPIPMIPTTNGIPPGIYSLGFDRQHAQIAEEQPPSSYRDPYGVQQRENELVQQRRQQREFEEKQAERLAFGTATEGDPSHRKVHYDPNAQIYQIDDTDIPLDFLIRPTRSKDPMSDRSSQPVDPISVRSITPRSPRKKTPHEPPISIKITTPRDPFSARKPAANQTPRAGGTPRKTNSPTIAERHREARQRQQQILSRAREENALRFADDALHGEGVPPTRALEEFNFEVLETSFTSAVRELAGSEGGLVNRTFDLDLMDDNDDMDDLYSERGPMRPRSAASSNSSSALPRPSSASSSRRGRPMTSMGKAIVQVKQKGPPPARSSMARKRPLSSPGNLGQKRASLTAPAKGAPSRTRMVPTMRKSSPPSHKPTTYNQRVRSLSKTEADSNASVKSDPTDPKALMRLYGTRRVPGLYKPYEKTEPRVVKTYSERMKELQGPSSTQTQPRRVPAAVSREQRDDELEPRPSSAPSSSISLSDWEVDERVKELLADDHDSSPMKRLTRTITPLSNLDELDDDNLSETSYSFTHVTEQTNENTYGEDLRFLQLRRPSATTANPYGGTRASARSSAGGDMTARDESELSKGESSIASYLDWSLIDGHYTTGGTQ